MARFVFTTLGSWGDLFPLIPIAKRLESKGHRVTFATTPAFADLLHGERLAFTPVGAALGLDEYAAHPEILDSRQGGLAGVRNLMRLFILPHLARVYADLKRACDGADVLVTHPAQLAAPMVAHALGVRWATVSVFPDLIPSAYTVPQGHPVPALPTALGRAANRFAWWFSRLVLRALFDRPLNDVRRECGLPPARDVFLLSGLSPQLCLVLCSPHYVARLPDWPASVELAGFVPWDEPARWKMPSELAAFLASGRPPITFTLGASLSIDPQRFFVSAADVLASLGERGVFLVGRDANLGVSASKDVAVVPFAPLSAVLRESRAVVHHGGFGTTAATLRAGLPSLVVPRAFDQFYHGSRVARLGVGRALAWSKLDAGSLHRELRVLLGDGGYRERATALGARLAGEDGSVHAAERLEQLLSAPPDVPT